MCLKHTANETNSFTVTSYNRHNIRRKAGYRFDPYSDCQIKKKSKMEYSTELLEEIQGWIIETFGFESLEHITFCDLHSNKNKAVNYGLSLGFTDEK